MSARVLLISPVYNEGSHIERVVRAVAAQTRPPARWIVVDDGSTDGTLETLRRLEPEINFLEVLERGSAPEAAGPPDRLAVALEALAFNRGLAHAGDIAGFTHVGKLDGDIELPPDYFEQLLDRFAADPQLGLAGGKLIEPDGDRWRPLLVPDHHIHGALKLFTRECFERVGGIQARLGWDTIDETYARMAGYQTRSYADIVAKHLRPVASADGQLRGRARHGECAWILHYGIGWILLRSLKVAVTEPPRGLSGLWFLYGYMRSGVRRTPRVEDPEFRRFTRRELRARLLGAEPGA